MYIICNKGGDMKSNITNNGLSFVGTMREFKGFIDALIFLFGEDITIAELIDLKI